MLSEASILACDPGGTKCHALLVSRDGQALGWGTGVEAGLSGRSEKAFLLAARGALANHTPQSLIIVTAGSQLKPVLNAGIPVLSASNVREDEAAFALAGKSCGLVVLAGTGAFVRGIARDGRSLHLDGIGPVLGDTGSAYSIGLMAMRAAAKSDWHLRFHTTLQERLYTFYKLSNISELITFSLKPADRSVIASFAQAVDEEANTGDMVARQILFDAADDIADIVHAVVERLEMTQEPYALIGTGSVIRKSSIYWNRLCEQVRHFAPLLTPMRPAYPAVIGVALVGLRRLPCPDYQQATAALLESYANLIKKGNDHDAAKLP